MGDWVKLGGMLAPLLGIGLALWVLDSAPGLGGSAMDLPQYPRVEPLSAQECAVRDATGYGPAPVVLPVPVERGQL